jgi:2-hydroxy-3-keto-5-methylthiopentenyl-1-phosphate phosphatase
MTATSAKNSDVAVLCDFDGTICTMNTMDFLYQNFASVGMKYAVRWERGEISTADEIRATFATVDSSREEMERALSRLEIDEGFSRFLDFCRMKGYHIAIVSDGLEWYIEYILGQHGIRGLPIYANQIRFENGDFQFEFPWFHEESPMRGVSKPHIVHSYQAEGKRVAYIGDGHSDVDVIHEADLVYARGWLADYCLKHDIPAILFGVFDDLLRQWQEP